MIPYNFLCDTIVFCSIPDLPYTVVGSLCEVFLKCHIWSLDRQCRGNNVTKFSWSAIYGRWIVSVTSYMRRSFTEVPYMVIGSSVSWITCDEVFLECHIWSLDRQCHGKHVTKFS